MSFDDLYNNFRIVKQEVKGTASSSSSSSSQNLDFVSSTSSTNEVNTAYGVSTANTQVSTASTQVSTANLSDDTVYAFLANQPNRSHLVHEDLEQIHEDYLEEMDLKWQLALLSMRTRKGPRNQDNRSMNQDSSRRTINVEEISSQAMLAIDGAGFDKSFMADEEVPTDMALMAFSDFEVHNDKTCSKTCLKSFETLKTQLDDLRIEFNKSEFNLATYKRGLASVEEQLVFYKKNEVLFCEQLVVLKRDISYKDSEISVLKSELEKLKQEKEKSLSNKLKIENFDNAYKSLDKLIGSQITDKSRKGVGFVSYNVVPPPPTRLFSPPNLGLSNSGLEEFQQPKFKGYGPKTSKSVSEDTSNEVRESPNASLVKELVSNDKLEKKTIFHTVAKINFVKPQQQEKPVRKPVKYAKMYRPKAVNTARPNTTVVNAVRENQFNAVKASTCWVWRPTKLNSASITFKRHNYVDARGRSKRSSYVDSGSQGTMTWNMSYLLRLQRIYGGYHVDTKMNSVLFIETGCFVLSPDFKLADESQVLLKVSRKNNIYSVDMKNIVPKEILTCLVAKATLDESMLWHRRIGHINFKTINKLVKDNLVKGLPIKRFENDQTCVACLKGKEHKASYYILMPLWKYGSLFDSSLNNTSNDEPQPSSDAGKKDDESGIDDQEKPKTFTQMLNVLGPNINTASINTGSININTTSPPVTTAPLEATYADFFSDETELDMSNITNTYLVPTAPNTRIHKDHSLDHVIGDMQSGVQTRRMTRNKKDKRGIVIRNKARLVIQGYTQEKGIDYGEVFALVTRIEEIRLFLTCTSFKDFVLYQMDVKSAFLYGKIEEEVYVYQPPGFEDPEFPDKVYKVEKALYGLHQALRAWYETLSIYLLDNGFQRGQIDKTLFIKRVKGDILLKDDGIFISQDKYVDEILKKFGFLTMKTTSTPMETSKPLLKDSEAEDVDVHLYRSMIGSFMYLTASRPDIMFAVCACARFQVKPKVSHLHAMKRIFRYLKGQPKFGLWYPKDSPFDLEAYFDSDYAGACLDRKSTIGGCQFLGSRLISWQCKKQTIVANSTTEEAYVAASSCCRQVLWIQNQLLDYGYNFMNTKIIIDNESTICIVKNPVFHSKTKHIEIRHPFIRDSNEKKLIQMIKIHTDHNVADLLTKAFDVGRFQYLITSIRMLNL
ncbi:putative ribonuclease H-like domain-containing protein [Tanacetum coccineum]